MSQHHLLVSTAAGDSVQLCAGSDRPLLSSLAREQVLNAPDTNKIVKFWDAPEQ